jgi:ribonuclease D
VYELVVSPESFRAAVSAWRGEAQLWIDTEIADWATKSPRISLLQVRDKKGRNWVVDVLDPAMLQILQGYFIPQVMENPGIEKWAHYARFERKYLGQDRVQNLNCTFEVARSVPYHRLPLKSLSLAALVEHYFGTLLDKGPQKADWGIRPLPTSQLEYAALDTEWCYRIHAKLRGEPPRPDASDDNPKEIETRYIDLLAPLKRARAVRDSIREPVKEFMISQTVSRLSRFFLQTRTTHSTDLGKLVEFAISADPNGHFDLRIPLVPSLLSPKTQAEVAAGAEISTSQSFRGPRAPRSTEPLPVYHFDPEDVERLTSEYEEADHNVLVLESERDDLRDRMRLCLKAQDLTTWGEFAFSEPRERWRVELRALKGLLATSEPIEVPFPTRLWLAFSEAELAQIFAAGQSRQSPVLRWLPRAMPFGFEAQQSRYWVDSNESAQ